MASSARCTAGRSPTTARGSRLSPKRAKASSVRSRSLLQRMSHSDFVEIVQARKFSTTVSVGQQPEVLMDEAQPELRGGSGTHRQLHRATVDLQFAARVGVMIAGEDLDQRGLAAPVLADKAVDLSASDAHG